MKRIFPAITTMAIVALALSGCSSGAGGSASASAGSDDGGVTELTFQSWVPNVDKAVDLFNASHPNIHVTLETITAGPDGGYATMFSAVKAGNAADVAQVGYDWLPDFVRNDAVEDITQYVSGEIDKFVDWQVSAMTFNDAIYGIPQASSPLGLYYRSDVFKKAGITKAPETWDEFYADAKLIRKLGKDNYIAAFAYNQTPWLIGLSEQAGAKWFTAGSDSWTVSINDDATMKVADYWQKLIDEDLVKVEADMSNEWYKDIQNGNVASWISGSWGDAIIRGNAPKTSGNWSVSYMPQWTAGESATGTWGGGSANVVLKGTKHAAEASEFALWLNSNAESVSTLVSIGAGWPAIEDTSAITSLTNDPDVFSFYNDQNIWKVFAESDANVQNDWRWPPLVSTLYSTLIDNVKSSIDNSTGLSNAFDETQTGMIDALTQAGVATTTN